MTNEEAIKMLVNAEYADKWQGNEELQTALHLAISALERDRWISVEERLPEESGFTIIFCMENGLRHVTFARFQKRFKRWDLTGARSYWRVTHWKPLPEPPKEET